MKDYNRKEDVDKVETLKILKDTYVNGRFIKAGQVVKLSGNDKLTLLFTKKAEVVETKGEKAKE